MLGETEKLLRTASLKADENLMGFLLRLTEINYCTSLAWIRRKVGINPTDPNSGCCFVFYSSLDLTSLASLTGNDKEKLAKSTYPLVSEEGLPKYTILVYGTPLPQYMVRIHNPKICPECLVESAHIRRIWDLAPVTVCPIHTCMLLDECQRCKRVIRWARNKVSVCSCNFDWRDSVTHPVEKKETELTQQIYKLCGLSSGQIETSESSDNPLYSLALKHLLSIIFFISGQYRGVADTKGKFLVCKLRNLELHSLLNKTFSVFEDWPNRFYQFLEWKRTQRDKSKVGTGLKKDFGKLYKYLYAEFSSESFHFIRSAFEEYIRQYWDGGCTSLVGKSSGGTLRSKKYISRVEAERRLHIKDTTLLRFIDTGKLKAILLSRAQKNLMLIELAAVEKLEVEFNQALSLNQTAGRLGVGRQTISRLMEHRCLDPLRGPSVDGCDDWKFSCSEVSELLKTIRAKIERNEAAALAGVITFQIAQKKFAFNNVNVGQFVQAMLKGELTPCGEGSGTGLARLLFLQDEIARYVKVQLEQRQGPLTVRQTSNKYKISENTIRILVDQEVIPVVRSPSTRKPNIFITKEDIEYFTKTYVLASKLASSLATSSYHLVRLLEAKGIRPIPQKRSNKRHQAIFKRSDFEGIDLRAKVLETKAEHHRTNHKTKILDIEEVATLLGTNIETVSRLAVSGFLRPYSGSRYKGSDTAIRYFTNRALQVCKSKIVGYMRLLSEPRVKQIIRRDLTNFYVVRVKEGGPEAKISETRLNIYPLLGRNAGALISLLGQTITLSEVRMKWGIERRTLKRRIANGILKTISITASGGFKQHLFLQRDIEQLH